MGVYHCKANGNNTVSSTVPLWALAWLTGDPRLEIVYMHTRSDATPADAAAEFALRRVSARGTTPTSFTPNPPDPAEPACASAFDLSYAGAQPTITANSDVFNSGHNARAAFQFIARPGKGIKTAAVSGSGLALMSDVATTVQDYRHSVDFEI